MDEAGAQRAGIGPGGRGRPARIAVAAAVATAVYLALALAGDLRRQPVLLLGGTAAALACMGVAWAALRKDAAGERIALAAALGFRIVAAAGEPALSDDVYRYVWDGRVQLAGVHPFAHAPADPELAPLRDADWERINHPGLRTIYPPLAEALFAALAASGARATGFRLAFGLLDFGVVLALRSLLHRLGAPRHRWVLYGFHPLAVLESAGSGHVEPAGVLLTVLAASWILARRTPAAKARARASAAAAALGAAVAVKLFPLVLVPGWLRRLRATEVAVLLAAIVLPVLPYAAAGPALGGGLGAYAARWEHNAVVFPAVRSALAAADSGRALVPAIDGVRARFDPSWMPWDAVYRAVWPGTLARLVVVGLAVGWILFLAFRPGLGPAREAFLVLGGVLLLLPTLHPWYVLWVLPFAAAFASGPWLLFSVLVVVSYAAGGADPGWGLRAIEYLPPLAWWAWNRARAARYHRDPG